MSLIPMRLLCLTLLATMTTANTAAENVLTVRADALTVVNNLRDRYRSPAVQPSKLLDANTQGYANALATQDNHNGTPITLTPTIGDLELCAQQMYRNLPTNLGSLATMRCGQSLFTAMGGGSSVPSPCNAAAAVRMWASQAAFYNNVSPPQNFIEKQNSTDFTQLVWSSTKFIGVGMALSTNSQRCFFVIRYWPSGNIIGKYAQNVNTLFLSAARTQLSESDARA